jgi:hypothetical protein
MVLAADLRGECFEQKERIVMSNTNRTTQQDRDRKMIAGIQAHLAKEPKIVIRSVVYTPESLIQVIQNDLNLADAATKAKAALADAAAAVRANRTNLRTFITGFRQYVLNTFTDANVITDFGFSPSKAPKKTVATKALAAARVVATRQARGTLGKVQKKEVHGSVVAITPVAGQVHGAATAAPVATPGATSAPGPATPPATGPAPAPAAPAATGGGPAPAAPPATAPAAPATR